MAGTALLLMPWLFALARASVSDTVLGGGPPTVVEQPAAEAPAPEEDPRAEGDGAPSGGSLVMCRGEQLCRGATSMSDGVRMCQGGLYCKDWALIVSSTAGDAPPLPQKEAGVAAESAESAAEDAQREALLKDLNDLDVELQTLAAPGPLDSSERLYDCPGGWGCAAWTWTFGFRWCNGGYRCMGWGNGGWHGGNDGWHGGDDHWHGGGYQPGNGGQGGWNGGGGYQPGNGGQGGWNGGGGYQPGNGGQGGWHGPGH